MYILHKLYVLIIYSSYEALLIKQYKQTPAIHLGDIGRHPSGDVLGIASYAYLGRQVS